MKSIFKYVENLWLGKDKKPSIRRVLALLFSIDMVINIHKSVDVLYKMGKSFISSNNLPPEAITATGGGLANIAMIIGTEAALITALLALTTYQNTKDIPKNEEFTEDDREFKRSD